MTITPSSVQQIQINESIDTLNKKLINMDANTIQKIANNIPGWGENSHQFSAEQVGAIQAAWLAKRPLLVRGDPGLGKSQMAAALASFLNFNFSSITVHADTEISDLLYRVDHIKRLAHAQGQSEQDEIDYVNKGVLWQTLAPKTEPTSASQCNENPQNKNAQGNLLLIDEIDKADASLPNALLEVLANRTINVLPLNQVVKQEANPAFILITSNDERELPAAFLRRCAILDLTLKEGEQGEEQLKNIFKAHQQSINQLANGTGFVPQEGNEFPAEVCEIAASIIKIRAEQKQAHEYVSGTSEFLDLLRALVQFPCGDERENIKATLTKALVQKTNVTG